jgi:hypothetical protein
MDPSLCWRSSICGVALMPGEIDVFVQSEVRLRFAGNGAARGWLL